MQVSSPGFHPQLPRVRALVLPRTAEWGRLCNFASRNGQKTCDYAFNAEAFLLSL